VLRIAVVTVIGCGYSAGSFRSSGEPYRVRIAPIVDRPAVDIDAAGLVATSIRGAILREQGLALVNGEPDGLLAVDLVSVDMGIGAFAEPSLRAARYQVTVVVECRLSEDGREVWRSPPIAGVAPFFSPPGRIEALDGASRRALEHASEQAAERAVAALMVTLLRTER
jgi:hypothetical protein